MLRLSARDLDPTAWGYKKTTVSSFLIECARVHQERSGYSTLRSSIDSLVSLALDSLPPAERDAIVTLAERRADQALEEGFSQ